MCSNKRPRIIVGELVRSTNEVQQSCIRELVIKHHYYGSNYQRIKREVTGEKPNQEQRRSS